MLDASTAKPIRGIVFRYAEVGVDTTPKTLSLHVCGFVAFNNRIVPNYRVSEISLDFFAYVDTIRLNNGTKKSNTVSEMLQVYFIRMQSQPQVFIKKSTDYGNERGEIRFVGMHDDKIVHISSVVPQTEIMLDEVV